MGEDSDSRILAYHKRWGDALSLVSMAVTLVVFVAAYLVMEEFGTEPLERIPAFILLATIVLVVVIWQAAALAIARLQIALQARRID